jgi:hypothetical protein
MGPETAGKLPGNGPALGGNVKCGTSRRVTARAAGAFCVGSMCHGTRSPLPSPSNVAVGGVIDRPGDGARVVVQRQVGQHLVYLTVHSSELGRTAKVGLLTPTARGSELIRITAV